MDRSQHRTESGIRKMMDTLHLPMYFYDSGLGVGCLSDQQTLCTTLKCSWSNFANNNLNLNENFSKKHTYSFSVLSNVDLIAADSSHGIKVKSKMERCYKMSVFLGKLCF